MELEFEMREEEEEMSKCVVKYGARGFAREKREEKDSHKETMNDSS